MKIYFRTIKGTKYFSKSVQVKTYKGWEFAAPDPYLCNFFEKLLHFTGLHFSFGQHYCVACGELKRKS